MSRLFTFGCSFTQYWRWPTWADALGQEFEKFQNWGLCGAGNSYILWSLIECNQRNQLGPDDEVWIMWTNTSREDHYVKDRWLEGGNVYWSAGSELPAEYVKKFACERGYLIRDMANMAAARQLLDHWGCKYRFLSMVPFTVLVLVLVRERFRLFISMMCSLKYSHFRKVAIYVEPGGRKGPSTRAGRSFKIVF